MEITQHNVCEHIESILKSLNIRYSILFPDSKGCVYQLYISSIEGNIQVEYDLDDEEDNYFILQFFTKVDTYGNSLYHSDWNNETPGDSIEGEIENLVEYAKKINQGISKIQIKIEQIKDICEEYELDFEEFIDVLYDFDS